MNGGFPACVPCRPVGAASELLPRAVPAQWPPRAAFTQRVQQQRGRMASSTPFRDAVSGGVGSVFCVYAGIPFDTVSRRRCQCTDSVRILTLVCVSAHAVACR